MWLETEINTLSIGTVLFLSADAHLGKVYHHYDIGRNGWTFKEVRNIFFYSVSRAMLNNNNIALFHIFPVYNVSFKQLWSIA